MRYSFIVLAFVFSGCATVFKGTSEIIHVQSNPAGATVYVNGLNMGTTASPQTLKKGFDSQTITLKKEGYVEQNLVVQRSFDPICFLNILFWPGFIVDAASGAMMKANQVTYVAEMEVKK